MFRLTGYFGTRPVLDRARPKKHVCLGSEHPAADQRLAGLLWLRQACLHGTCEAHQCVPGLGALGSVKNGSSVRRAGARCPAGPACRYGYKGFYDRRHKPVVLTRKAVEGIQLQGGTLLVRGPRAAGRRPRARCASTSPYMLCAAF